jgi:hypothetical protein
LAAVPSGPNWTPPPLYPLKKLLWYEKRYEKYNIHIATGGWKKSDMEKFIICNLQNNIIRAIKSSSMRQMGYALHTTGIRNAYKISVEEPKGKRSLGRP